jgi:hypothetical protein
MEAGPSLSSILFLNDGFRARLNPSYGYYCHRNSLIGVIAFWTGVHLMFCPVGKETLKVTKSTSMHLSAGYLALINETTLQKSDLFLGDAVNGLKILRNRIGEVGINDSVFIGRFVPTIILKPVIDTILARRFFGWLPVVIISKAVLRYVYVVDVIDRGRPIIIVGIVEITSRLFANIFIFKNDVGFFTSGAERIHKNIFWPNPRAGTNNNGSFRLLKKTKSQYSVSSHKYEREECHPILDSAAIFFCFLMAAPA